MLPCAKTSLPLAPSLTQVLGCLFRVVSFPILVTRMTGPSDAYKLCTDIVLAKFDLNAHRSRHILACSFTHFNKKTMSTNLERRVINKSLPPAVFLEKGLHHYASICGAYTASYRG
jgi:hypothetical protein